ncbi:DgyrCDS12254 [Dimorphilus gyrociliatus]|uniref:DgyrCDS12254 n=1 Tax=Dimorphilus gyrociliatus TaxID=2664684 RepID=A0A7I8W5W8_9ANNE|nr:DgyrCDS12254 [Dimorphilus gyrociliatus]
MEILFSVFESDNHIVIILELAARGEIYDLIEEKGRLEEDDARYFFKQLLSSLAYLHSEGIVHRDLKLENLLLDENHQLKICDFGLANSFGEEKLTTFCGSALYSSPEIVNGIPYEGPEVDMWSLGVILYTFVYGNMPFSGDKFDEIKKNITLGQFSEPEFYSGAHNLITRLLNPRASKRLTLLQACSHSWINNDAFYENVLKLFQDCKNESTTTASGCLSPDLDDFLELERRVEEESRADDKLNLSELKKSADEVSQEIEDKKDESLELEDEAGDEYTYDDMMKELLSIDENESEKKPEPEPELQNEIEKPLSKNSATLTESQCENELRNLLKTLTKSKDEADDFESKFNSVYENETDFILRLCDSSRTSES